MNNLILYKKEFNTKAEHDKLIEEMVSKQIITLVAQRKTERYLQAPFQVYNPLYHHTYYDRETSLVSFGQVESFPLLIYVDNNYDIIKPIEKILIKYEFENKGKVKALEVNDLGWLIEEMSLRAYFIRTNKVLHYISNSTQSTIRNKLILGVVYKDELDSCFQSLNDTFKTHNGNSSRIRLDNYTLFQTYHIPELDEAVEFVTLYKNALNKNGLVTTLLNSVQNIEVFDIRKVKQYLLSNK